MQLRSICLAALLATSGGQAQAVTADEAGKLQATLQSYFGGTPGFVKVEPDGDSFKATFDPASMLAKSNVPGLEASMTPIEFALKPLGGGKWSVKHQGNFKISAAMKDAFELEESIADLTYDGEFDEALGAFSRLEASGKSASVREDIKDPNQGPMKVDLKIESVGLKGSASAISGGATDITIKESFGPIVMHETVSPKNGGGPIQIDITADGGAYDFAFAGAKSLELLALLKFFVAHIDKAKLLSDQQELKSALQAAIPLWNNLTAAGTFKNVQVNTPIGSIRTGSIAVNFALAGVVKDGKLREKFSFEGLTLPPGVIPPWASSLVPKSMSLDFNLSGYDAATPAAKILQVVDFSKQPPVPDTLQDELKAAFMPGGKVNISLGKSAIAAEAYVVNLEGSMTAGPEAKPSGKAHINAKGVDEVMKVIQAAPPDAGVQGGLAAIIAAKGLGKVEADGSFTWDVEATSDDKLLVNGNDISKMLK